MNVLVAYATRHGATGGIAERIASILQAEGHTAEALPVAEVRDLGPYDAVVLGGAAYVGRWLKDATRFAKRHEAALLERQVWLFSSGPLGTNLVDKAGRDVLASCRPKEFDDLTAALHPRGERVFFGAWDRTVPPIGIGERVVRAMPVSAESMPSGDFRDWPAIEAWAREIATELPSAALPG